MTVKGKLQKMVYGCGMFEDPAAEVVALAIPQINALTPGYRIDWDGPSDAYPELMYTMWFGTAAKVAVKWIDENLPEAWCRPVFEALAR